VLLVSVFRLAVDGSVDLAYGQRLLYHVRVNRLGPVIAIVMIFYVCVWVASGRTSFL